VPSPRALVGGRGRLATVAGGSATGTASAGTADTAGTAGAAGTVDAADTAGTAGTSSGNAAVAADFVGSGSGVPTPAPLVGRGLAITGRRRPPPVGAKA